MYKYAAISPAIQALQQQPTGEAQKTLFEQNLGQMAYSTFAAKFPDLVESIVTYKTMSSDVDTGAGFGTFILDIGGETSYVPAVFHDNEISPLEILYVKARDMFVPLTPDWVAEVERSGAHVLGEPGKLPPTVSTDVDIRNLVVPPTTGRYSYAAANEAALGQDVMQDSYDPLVWEGFVEQYAKLNGMTPGVALDMGRTRLDDLTKLYKGHEKTWGAPTVPPYDPSVPGMKQASRVAARAARQAAAPATAAAPAAANAGAGLFERGGRHLDRVSGKAVESAAIGGLLGGATSVYDGNYSNVGERMAAGAAGGAALGTAGHLIGSHLNANHPSLGGMGDEIGQLAGTLGGAIGGARPETFQKTPDYGMYGGYQDQYRYASMRADDGGVALLKHAMAPAQSRTPKLLEYLTSAPNRMKVAFASTLAAKPTFHKAAVKHYGNTALTQALTKHAEEAPAPSPRTGNLKITDTYEGTKAFGERSPLAFRGVALRGYYYEDKKPSKNIAVVQQEYRNASDTREPGVYTLYTIDGEPHPALVIQNPVDLDSSASAYMPSKVRRYEYGYNNVGPEPRNAVQRSHKVTRIVVRGNGDWCSTDREIAGELGTPECLEGTKLYKYLFTDSPSPVRAGHGFFVCTQGSRFECTEPVTLSDVSKDSYGVTTAKIRHGRTVRIDPRATYARPVRPQGADYCTVPGSWRWVPLADESSELDGLCATADEVVATAFERMPKKTVRVRDTGAAQMSVDGSESLSKAAAMARVADTYGVSGADAEAIVKIAEKQRYCEAYVVSRQTLQTTAKTASVVEQAFSEVLQELGAQMENIQGQMQVLQTVQERAQALSGGQPAPDAQGAPAEQPVEQPADPQAAPQAAPAPAPEMQSQDPSMQQAPVDPSMDPNMQQAAEVPPPPMMNTEAPSSQEIASQINPAFLDQAAALNQQGVFDAGVLGELQRAAQRSGDAESRGLGTGNKDLAETVDDLGRTLLTMQLRQGELKASLSENVYAGLEDQVRNTFKSLGRLMLELDQHTAALTHEQDETAT